MASQCAIGIWNRFLRVRWFIQLQPVNIHYTTNAKLRWEIQLEGIRTHLLYDDIYTALNGLELLTLLIFYIGAYSNAA